MPAFRDRPCRRRRRCGGRHGFAIAFRAGRVVLGSAQLARRVGRTRLIVMMLVAGLVAVSCGSDDGGDGGGVDSFTDLVADTPAEPSDVSAAGSEDPPVTDPATTTTTAPAPATTTAPAATTTATTTTTAAPATTTTTAPPTTTTAAPATTTTTTAPAATTTTAPPTTTTAAPATTTTTAPPATTAEENVAPAAGLVPAQEAFTGESLVLDLSRFFSDRDGDELVYEAASSNAAVATAAVSGSTVSVSGIDEGTAAVTVTARDPDGLSAEQRFEVAVVHRWRAEHNLDPFYEKFRDAGGLPIVASAQVPDEALDKAQRLVGELLADNPGVLAHLIAEDIRVAIMAAGSVVTDIPEFRDLYEVFPGVDWDTRNKGGGLGPNPNNRAIAVAEENLLCYDTDVFPYEDVALHEIAHAVLNMGIEQQPGGSEFRQRLERAYHDALSRGLWAYTYAAVDPDEYWAEGVTSWFDLNGLPGPLDNGINTRPELKAYDPALAALVQEVFGDAAITSSCHPRADSPGHPRHRIQGTVVGPDAAPVQGIGVWAWQGDPATSGYALTASDGTFFIAVSDGSFTLDVHLNNSEGCTFAGWHGSGGFTTDANSATRIRVDGANVEGITIKLPGQPNEVPYHENCP